MNLWKIAWRSIEQRSLASLLTGLSMALGVALVVAVLVVYGVVDASFRKNAAGYDLIVGAKGGKLQLVLNTVYHLSTPVENIPYGYYKEFLREQTPQGTRVGRFAKDVQVAIPYCLGDNYQGFRVVGTIPAMFDNFEYAPNERYEFAQGRNFKHENFFEGVIGSLVARQTGLKVGDYFEPTHGVVDDGQGHKHDAFRVVGVLKPTGTPNDRALFVNMEGFYLLSGHAKQPPPEPTGHNHEADHDHKHGDDHDHQPAAAAGSAPPRPQPSDTGTAPPGHDGPQHADDHPHDTASNSAGSVPHAPAAKPLPAAHAHDHAHHDHEHHHHEPLPENQREVTAILIRTSPLNPVAALTLPRAINKDNVAQAVAPAREIYNMLDGIVGPLQTLLLALAGLIVVVAGVGIMVSIYNSMNDRRRDIAIMRSLGASRRTVLAVVLLESILLSLFGGLAGFVLGHGLIAAMNPVIVPRTGVEIGFFQFPGYTFLVAGTPVTVPVELFLLPALVALASLVGFLPAMSAYRTDVAKALSASP